MKPYRNYIAFFILLLLGYVVYVGTQPKEVHWFVTFRTSDQSPFGSFLLHERANDLFEDWTVSYSTISQFEGDQNLLIITERLEMHSADLARLYELLNEGKEVMIVAGDFGELMHDSLGFSSDYRFQFYGVSLLESEEQKVFIGKDSFQYPVEMTASFFELDTDSKWTVIASTENGPMGIRRNIGKGKLILVTNPLIFTNFGLLYNENHKAAETLLKELSSGPLHYSMFYQFGRPEASTPLRYFLSQPALKWGVYLAIFAIVAYLGIDSWRKQRSIPIVLPPSNTSIEYAQTLGGLFQREGNHYKTALKLITHFYSDIRERYWLEPEFSDKFYGQLAGKSGVDNEHVLSTFKLIEQIRKTPGLAEEQLVDLSRKIDVFK
jgi:hypothetical protein